MVSSWEDIGSRQYEIRETPVAVPADARVSRRIVLILLILKHCRSSQANLDVLHALDWGLQNSKSRRLLVRCLSDEGGVFPFRYDALLDRAIAYAEALGLVAISSDIEASEQGLSSNHFRVKLTELGLKSLSSYLLDGAVLVDERRTLRQIGSSISMTDIAELLSNIT